MQSALATGTIMLALCSSTVSAAETTTYQYDAKGRLTQVAHAGGRANGAIAAYAYDVADNRTQATVAGAPARVVVVPLNGLQVIVLPPDG